MNFLRLLYLALSVLFISSCNMAEFGDYKPLYFKDENDLKNANDYINSLGYKTISEYTTKVNILDFPKNKEITINNAKMLSNSDLRKDTFLQTLPNLFNIEKKKLLYVENKFKVSDLKKLKKDLDLNIEIHTFDYKTKINFISRIAFFMLISLLISLNIKYSIFTLIFSIFTLIFLSILSKIFIITEESIYFYPLTILYYLLFSMINSFNQIYNKIYLQDLNFLTIIKKIKYLLFLYLFINLYYIMIINFFTIDINPKFIAFLSMSSLCIVLISIWIKIENNSKKSFLLLIEIKEQKIETKFLKSKIIVHLLLFITSLVPFIYSNYILNFNKNFNCFYSQKLYYFDYLDPNNIYIMKRHNKKLPNIVDYLSHILYQIELKHKIKSQYGEEITKNTKKNYFERKNNKIIINHKTVYKVNKKFIDKVLQKKLARLFLNNKNPILIYKENSDNIKTTIKNSAILFTFSLPFFILLFLFKAIRFTILLNLSKKTLKTYSRIKKIENKV